MARKSKKPLISPYQRRQRELAWVLYITEGYISNLEHALAVNCVTFENNEHDAVGELISAAREHADNVRSAMQQIPA